MLRACFALTAYPIGVKRKYLTRTEAIDRVLTTLWFFSNSEQSDAADATGYKGRFLPQSRVTR